MASQVNNVKREAIGVEYAELLSKQFESQREYFDDQIATLETDAAATISLLEESAARASVAYGNMILDCVLKAWILLPARFVKLFSCNPSFFEGMCMCDYEILTAGTRSNGRACHCCFPAAADMRPLIFIIIIMLYNDRRHSWFAFSLATGTQTLQAKLL